MAPAHTSSKGPAASGASTNAPPTSASASAGYAHLTHEVPLGPRLESVLALAYRARRPVLLEGPTGIGKSEMVRHVAQSLGIATAVLDLSLLEPPDLVGLPVLSEGRTSYAVPASLPREGAGILLLEELNRAERYIQQPALQLLTARRLHEYTLPPGWACFAAINPEDGDYAVSPLDRALRARFLTLRVRPDRGAWLAWAGSHGVHPAVLAVVRGHERAFDDVPPRTWTYAGELLSALTEAEARDEGLLRDALGGYLPASWLETLLAERESTSERDLGLDVREMLASYAPGSSAAKTLRSLREGGRTDAVDELVQRALAIVRGPEVAALAEQKRFSLAAFEALLADVPGDLRDRLSEALGKNPVASVLLDVHPHDVVQRYGAAGIDARVRAWKSDPAKAHRLDMLLVTLRAHLEAQSKGPEFRKSNTARINLGLLLAALPERVAMPLVKSLLELGITPVKPA